MNKSDIYLPIGIFDSGIGGISVLAEMMRKMPGEKFIYMADSANAPYGTKTCGCVREVSLSAAKMLSNRGIKALVVACNTATSVSINYIREQFDIPVIGMEPAVKPAVEQYANGVVIVLATPLTLKEEKFNNLYRRFNSNATIVPVPCPGLVELIESEAATGEIIGYLRKILGSVSEQNLSSVVLGCTHYCFIRNEIVLAIGRDIPVFDGNSGTVKRLMTLLESKNLLLKQTGSGFPPVEFITTGSSEDVLPLCRRFLEKALKT